MRAQAGIHLEAAHGVGCQERKHSVGRRGSDELHPAGRSGLAEGGEQVVAQALAERQRAPVALRLGLASGAVLRAEVAGVQLDAVDAKLGNEAPQALRHAVRLQLVGEHGRDRERDPVGHVEHGQVGTHESVEQPLLAKRVGAEALDIWHVAVEHEHQGADGLLRFAALAAGRRGLHRAWQTAMKSSARSRSHSSSARSSKSDAAIAGTKRP
jgi:hypothetical protein